MTNSARPKTFLELADELLEKRQVIAAKAIRELARQWEEELRGDDDVHDFVAETILGVKET